MKTFPLLSQKTDDKGLAVTKALLWCGVLSSLWYGAMNVYVPMQDPSYDWMSQTVSELSAIGAPTRSLWVGLGWFYTLLLLGFGFGLWRSNLRWIGGVMIIQGVLNPLWPPMHLRPVLAAGGGTLSDSLHIAFTAVWAVLSMMAIGFGAASLGRGFRLYSLVSMVLLLSFGLLTGQGAPRMEANLTTPWIGVWERLSIGLFMLWVLVFSLIHLRKQSRLRS